MRNLGFITLCILLTSVSSTAHAITKVPISEGKYEIKFTSNQGDCSSADMQAYSRSPYIIEVSTKKPQRPKLVDGTITLRGIQYPKTFSLYKKRYHATRFSVVLNRDSTDLNSQKVDIKSFGFSLMSSNQTNNKSAPVFSALQHQIYRPSEDGLGLKLIDLRICKFYGTARPITE